jgi:hypothetical protein
MCHLPTHTSNTHPPPAAVASAQCIGSVRAHHARVTCLALAADQPTTLLTGAEDGSVRAKQCNSAKTNHWVFFVTWISFWLLFHFYVWPRNLHVLC